MIEYSLLCAGIALPILLVGWLTVILANLFTKRSLDLKNADTVTKVGLLLTLVGVAGVVIAVLGLMASAAGWLWTELTSDLTPKMLALYSMLLAPSPFLLTFLGLLIAKILGGQVDASGARQCKFRGVDLGAVVYSLFMSYFLVFISGGLAVIGLIVSGLWVLLK